MRHWIVGLVAFPLIGCVGAKPIRLDSEAGIQRLKSSDAVEISLLGADELRIDRYIDMFGRMRAVETGPFWNRAFIGDPQHEAILDIKRAELKESVTAAGFAARYVYSVDATLSYKGRIRSLHAEGTRAAAMNVIGAMREAVELGVQSTAADADKILTKLRSSDITD